MAYIEQTFVDGVTVVTAAWLNGLKDVLGAASLFQIYNPTQTYNVGDFVSYQAKLYKCTTQIAVPEAWNPAHWTPATIADYVSPQKIFWGEYGVSTFAEIDAAINDGMLPLIKYNVTEYNARYAYYKKINKIKYTPQYIVTEYTFEDYQSDDVLTKLTISSATGWRTEETDFHDQLIEIEAQLEAITDQSDNLFNDIIAFNNSTGITRNKNEFVGTASAFQTFFIAPYNLDENKSYTVSFDIYTEGNSSTSGVGLKLCTGTRSDPDEGGYEFDNDQLEPYHYKGWYAISFGPVVQDRAWGIYFEADSAPDNVWHISNIELTEGEEELEEYKPRYTAKDDVARSGVEKNTEKIEDVEDYALGAYIENEASGAVVSFSDGAEGLPVKELTVDIEPVQAGSGDPSPDNIRPITGYTECNVYVSPTTDVEDATTYPITFPDGAGTVYGGHVTVNQDGSGSLSITKGFRVLSGDSTETWKRQSTFGYFYIDTTFDNQYKSLSEANFALSNKYVQVPYSNITYMANNKFCIGYVNSYYRLAVKDERFSTVSQFVEELATNNLEICYRLEQPIIVPLTEEETSIITSLYGTNNVWADCGDISNLVYYVDIQNILEEILSEITPIREEQIDVLI